MPGTNSHLQLNQMNTLLGDSVGIGIMKKGGLAAGLLSSGKAAKTQGFDGLLSGLLQAQSSPGLNPSLNLLAAAGEGGAAKAQSASIDALLAALPPQTAQALRALTPEDFNAIVPQLASLLGQTSVTASGAEGANTQAVGILDALSAAQSDDAAKPELFTMIEDPKLAQALAGVVAKIKAMQSGKGPEIPPVATTLPTAVAHPDTVVPQPVVPAQSIAANADDADGTTTITIADLNGDGFQALKKIMFADIAPFLTMPHTVRIDKNTIMKVAQGPAFLHDDDVAANAMALMAAGLGGTVPSQLLIGGTGAPQQTTKADAAMQAALAASTANTANGVVAAATNPATANAAATQLPSALQFLPGATKATSVQGNAAKSAGTGTAIPTAGIGLPDSGATPSTHTPLVVVTPMGQQASIAPSTSESRGFGEMLKGLEHGTIDADATQTFDIALRFHSDQSQPASATANLLTARGAAMPHPATHLVSVALARSVDPATPGEREFTIQLDPASLGRVRITLQIAEDNSVRAKLVAERPETLALLQKDAGALDKALQNAGLTTSGSEGLSFNLGGSDSFSQNLRDGGGSRNNNTKNNDDGTDLATIETVMPIFVDPATGLTHVNVVV